MYDKSYSDKYSMKYSKKPKFHFNASLSNFIHFHARRKKTLTQLIVNSVSQFLPQRFHFFTVRLTFDSMPSIFTVSHSLYLQN